MSMCSCWCGCVVAFKWCSNVWHMGVDMEIWLKPRPVHGGAVPIGGAAGIGPASPGPPGSCRSA
eukprot:12097943-Alexandrium_andersonii.AAC.1